MAKKVKITIVKADVNQDLIDEYSTPGFGVCPVFKVGDEFICTKADRPKGFCHEAWHVIYHYIFTFIYSTDDVDFGFNWINRRNLAIVSCNDGLRPVVFKIEGFKDVE